MRQRRLGAFAMNLVPANLPLWRAPLQHNYRVSPRSARFVEPEKPRQAAACACPKVTIVGPLVVDHWRPWRTAHPTVAPKHENSSDGQSLHNTNEASELMNIGQAVEALKAGWNASTPDLLAEDWQLVDKRRGQLATGQ